VEDDDDDEEDEEEEVKWAEMGVTSARDAGNRRVSAVASIPTLEGGDRTATKRSHIPTVNNILF
jgi:hypothetical protein